MGLQIYMLMHAYILAQTLVTPKLSSINQFQLSKKKKPLVLCT